MLCECNFLRIILMIILLILELEFFLIKLLEILLDDRFSIKIWFFLRVLCLIILIIIVLVFCFNLL